jgi:hypothetical protein
MAKRMVEAGQRYRDLQPGIYGRSAASDWVVEAVHIDALGIRHARLVSVADPSERKTRSRPKCWSIPRGSKNSKPLPHCGAGPKVKHLPRAEHIRRARVSPARYSD